MKTSDRAYIAIDLKSFYASVECRERGLDPLTTNLVVADESRTEKTICLAVSPSLKAFGIPGRARLFEVVQRVRHINEERRRKAPNRVLKEPSFDAVELARDPSREAGYITARPRMAFYMQYSTRIYQIYTRFVAPEDIHVYSIDEVFMDVTHYLNACQTTARELAMRIIHAVLEETGITATAGIGTNLYLAKIAMDIEAKHIPPDKDGVRIAELDIMSYRQKLWNHRPLTDFWRVGPGIARKLEANGIYTMGDIARCSLDSSPYTEEFLYRLFGVNAELLIDHAWGEEPCAIADIRSYRPETNSISSGQVLQHPYEFEKARLVVWEMADSLAYALLEKRLVTDQLSLIVGYDIDNLTDSERAKHYRGSVETDRYGRKIPKPAHGNIALPRPTSSAKQIAQSMMTLFDRVADPNLLIRRMYVIANRIVPEESVSVSDAPVQLDLFTDYEAEAEKQKQEDAALEKERSCQEAVLAIRRKYGKNAILKGKNFEEGATAKERNRQIGGHRA